MRCFVRRWPPSPSTNYSWLIIKQTFFDKISLLCLEHRQSRESTTAISPTQAMVQPPSLPVMETPTLNIQTQTHPPPPVPQSHGLHTTLPNDSGVDLPSQPSQPSLTFHSPSRHQHPDFSTTSTTRTRALYIDTLTQIQPQHQAFQHPHPQPRHQSLHQRSGSASGSLLTTTYPPLSRYHTHTHPNPDINPQHAQQLPLPLPTPMSASSHDHRLFASPSASEYFPYFDAGFDASLNNTGLDAGWEEGGLQGD